MSLDKQLQQLEENLVKQQAAHEQLLALAKRKVEAMRKANHQDMIKCLQLENDQVQTISRLETQRLELVAQITLMLEPKAAEPMRMEHLAQRLPEPARGRLLVLRMQLREKMERVRQEIGLLRRVSESLLNHMQGLVQTVGSSLTGVATYGNRGKRPQAAMAVSTFSATA